MSLATCRSARALSLSNPARLMAPSLSMRRFASSSSPLIFRRAISVAFSCCFWLKACSVSFLRCSSCFFSMSRWLCCLSLSAVALATFLAQREPQEDSPYVFPSQRAERLTEAGIHHWFRGLKVQAKKNEWELIEALSYHDLRHDFAHRARAKGWSLEEIAYYLGHITQRGTPAVQTTVRYTQASREQIKAKLKLLS